MGKYDYNRTHSNLISYVEGEPPMQRHARRLEFNLKAQEWVREQTEKMGLALRVTNEGHHWQFRGIGYDFKADWWPSSAKLVLNSRFNSGIHVHDYERAMQEIQRAQDCYLIETRDRN